MALSARQKAEYAEIIKENPLWEQMFEDFGQYYYAQFRRHTDLEMRNRISLSVDMLEDFKIMLEAYIIEGAMEDKTLENNDERT